MPSIAPSVASVGSITFSATSPDAIPVPSGVTAGSLVLVWVWAYWLETTTAPTSAVFTPPAGFVLADFQSFLDTTDSLYAASAWYYKYATAADTGTYSFGATAVNGTNVSGIYGTAERIAGGPSNGSPLVDSVKFVSSGSSTSSITISSFTPGGDYSLLLAGYEANSSGGTANLPGGWTSDSTSSSQGALVLGHTTQATATSTGSLNFSVTGPAGPQFAHLITLRPSTLFPMPWLSFVNH